MNGCDGGQADGRARILEAATRVFAIKGYEGSRIDEIAREAGVPKSLIYYHFKSKDGVLEALTKQFIDEYTALIAAAQAEPRLASADRFGERMKERCLDFERRNADLIRVMLIDSLKKENERPILFRVVDAMVQAEAQRAGAGFDRQERLAAEFFTRLIPSYAYICFADAWVNAFGATPAELEERFLRLLVDTHGAYHLRQGE